MGTGQKTNQELDRRFWPMFPFTRVSFRVPVFDPQPHGNCTISMLCVVFLRLFCFLC